MKNKKTLLDVAKEGQKLYLKQNISYNKLNKIIEEAFKDYKDPTEGMTLGQKKLFGEAMKDQVSKLNLNTSSL